MRNGCRDAGGSGSDRHPGMAQPAAPGPAAHSALQQQQQQRQAPAGGPASGGACSGAGPRVRAHVRMGPNGCLEVAVSNQPALRQALQQCASLQHII